MKLINSLSVKQLANFLECSSFGNENIIITGINEIHKVEKGDLIFVDHPKYFDKALNSIASAIIINDSTVTIPKDKAIIFSKDPFESFNKLTNHFSPSSYNASMIGDNIKIGSTSFIHQSAVIGNDVTIGENCTINANVCIYDHSTIGNNVTIHAGTVIGANAFYYKKYETEYSPMHSCGKVIIEDYVEIGALSSIDRGVTGNTIVKKGTKMDNQVHIGHDTVIGENCLFAAQVGIAGCVTIEDNVILWGQVGVASNLTIGKGAVVLGQSGLNKSIDGNKTYFGSPVSEARSKFKEIAAIRKLPKIIETLS